MQGYTDALGGANHGRVLNGEQSMAPCSDFSTLASSSVKAVKKHVIGRLPHLGRVDKSIDAGIEN